MVKGKGSKKLKVEKLRILDALIRKADGFLQSDTEIPTKIITTWHANAREIIAKVAGPNSREAREFKRVQLRSPGIADQYFRKRLGEFLSHSQKDKVVNMPRSRTWHRHRAIAEAKEILLSIKLKFRD